MDTKLHNNRASIAAVVAKLFIPMFEHIVNCLSLFRLLEKTFAHVLHTRVDVNREM